MPNKTIYVSDGDMPLFQRATDLAGGNLSAAISSAIRRFVDVEDAKRDGYDEVIVKVGIGARRKVRFVGALIGEWLDSTPNRAHTYRVYRTRTGKFVLYVDRSPEFTMVGPDGKPAGWRGHLGIGDVKYTSAPRESTIDIVDSLDELRPKVPAELFEMVQRSADQPPVEDLDI